MGSLPADSEQFMLIDLHVAKWTDTKEYESMMNNGVNIKRLQEMLKS